MTRFDLFTKRLMNYRTRNQPIWCLLNKILDYFCSFFRVGAIILALHDASDVFMESAKIFKYSENEFGASLCFALFALSWLLLRLTYFPFWIIRATRYPSTHTLLLNFNVNSLSDIHTFNCLKHWTLGSFGYDISWRHHHVLFLQHNVADASCFPHILVVPHLCHDCKTT